MRSETIAALATSLAKAQADVKGAAKVKKNEFFKNSKYADLAAVWEACREALTKNDLSVTQTTDFDEKELWCLTTLMHKSGEWITSRYPLRPVKMDPQGFGSAYTYARRFSLAAMVGVAPEDEDDDGNEATKPAAKTASSASLKRAGIWDRMLGEIEACKNEGQLIQWQDDNIVEVNKLPENWREQVLNQLELRAEELRPKTNGKQSPAEWAKSAMTTISKLTDASFIDQWELQNEKLIAALKEKSFEDWKLLKEALTNRRAALHPVNA